jgi:hypothetical protein
LSSPVRSLRTSDSAAVFSILFILLLLAATGTLMVKAEQNSGYESVAKYVDLAYLVEHPAEFENQSVTTNGTVKYYASIFMYEDFWLQAQNNAKIPVVTRSAKLSVPPVESLIKVSGMIQHSNLEGGFYFLNASSWAALNASSVTTATPSPSSTPSPTPSVTPSATPEPRNQSANPSDTSDITSNKITAQEQDSYGSSVPLNDYLLVFAVIVATGAATVYLLNKHRK